MKKLYFWVAIIGLLFVKLSSAGTPTYISTFQSIGLYWSPVGGADSLLASVQYRVEGSTEWRDAYAMRYMPISGTTKELADYRGSIVNLTPNTSYEIVLTLENTNIKDTIIAKTWSEDFPIAKTVVVGDSSAQINITESGTADGYILIDGTGSTIDVNNKYNYCVFINASYVIIRGFKLTGAIKHGIYLENCTDVIIEECDISNWGEEEVDHLGFGKDSQSGVYSGSSVVKRIVVQRCLIHDPRWDSSNWSEYREPFPNDPYHARGPQAITMYCAPGNFVFRYNDIWSDYEHMYTDVIGGGKNASYDGSPNADSDIYGNYIANCWDDAIQAEGANRNVRIWGNYIENVYLPIANAPTTIGPLYVWKNTTGRSYTPPGSQLRGTYGAFIKMGYASNESWMTGMTYLFNNTITQPDGEGSGGIGAHYGSDRKIRHCVTRNNVLHVRKYDHSISTDDWNSDYDYDYDLCNKKYPEGSEIHGIDGDPVYVNDAKFDSKTMTANFFLTDASPGYDMGEVLPNFSDGYEGSAPDIGAFESGQTPIEYGINAYIDGIPNRYVFRVLEKKHGKVTPNNGVYTVGAVITVTAVPDSGYAFDGWGGDLSGNKNPQEITMSSNQNISASFVKVTSIEDNDLDNLLPVAYSLSQNYPNPFNPTTAITFSLPQNSDINLSIYNLLGQKVAELVNGKMVAGYHEVSFNAINLSSGVYVYKIVAGNFVAVKKMILLK